MKEYMINVWPVKTLKVKELFPNEKNPRKISDSNFERLKNKIQKQGFHTPPKIDNDGVLLGGNMRFRALLDMGLGELEIPVMYPPKQLSERERQEVIVSDNLQEGEWDYDVLANDFEIDLTELGIDLPEIDIGVEKENIYSDKIARPTYEPQKDTAPPLSELFFTDKYFALIKQIKEKKLPEAVEMFLTFAAARHIVFNYENIAEFYCHQNVEVQDLMEKSALVIIDFEKAIEEGFIKLTNEIQDSFDENSGEVEDE